MPIETSAPPTIERREELFGKFDPNFRTLDPLMLDSMGQVAQAISGIVSPRYGGISVWDSRIAIDLLIHHQVGLSRSERRATVPFIRETSIAEFLTRNSPSIILLDISTERLPGIRGLNASINKFNELTQSMDDPDLDLRRFQVAVPFRRHYTDPYSEVQTEIVSDSMAFRLQKISSLIRAFENKDPQKAQELRKLHYSLQHAFNFDGLRVEYGNPRDNIADAVPSCVTGLVGTVREAALAYEADPNIEIIGLYPYLESAISTRLGIPSAHMDQIIKSIAVKVFDRQANDEVKLVVDGVIADDHLGKILGLDWRPYMAAGLLEYAKNQGIRHIVVNTGNSGNHESVNAFTYFIATECLGLVEGRDFSYNVDATTGNHVFRLQPHHFRDEINGFPYTHYLEKDPMPQETVDFLAAGKIYKGELYLETWYAWMTHVHNHRNMWDAELRARFPYVEQRDPDMKPAWNLGRGPMRGLELDVASVLPKIKLSP